MARKRNLKKAEEAVRKMSQQADLPADASKPPQKKQKQRGKGTWKLMERWAAVIGTVLSAQATGLAWRMLSGKKAPMSGRHPDISTKEAALYAIVAGALSELVKTSVRRSTATYWVRSTGHLPPGMKPLSDTAPSEGTEFETAASKTPMKTARKRRIRKR